MDDGSRDLGGYTFASDRMTGALCIQECRARNFTFAATQFSAHCFCGNSYGRLGPARNCDMRCTGNSGEICGGSWANSVYSTGLR